MPSPFPGMDPYLEEPRRWPDVHQSLITYIRDALQPAVRPRYFARHGRAGLYHEPAARRLRRTFSSLRDPSRTWEGGACGSRAPATAHRPSKPISPC